MLKQKLIKLKWILHRFFYLNIYLLKIDKDIYKVNRFNFVLLIFLILSFYLNKRILFLITILLFFIKVYYETNNSYSFGKAYNSKYFGGDRLSKKFKIRK